MPIQTDALLWMTLGIALLSSEAFTGTSHLLFFGLSALATAVLASTGLNAIPLQLAVFGGTSFLGFLILKAKSVHKQKKEPSLHRKMIRMNVELLPNQQGEVLYNGVTWSAINRSNQPLRLDDSAVVIRTEGVTLILAPESQATDFRRP